MNHSSRNDANKLFDEALRAYHAVCFLTQTHLQSSARWCMMQVVRELKRAGYKPKMAILVPLCTLAMFEKNALLRTMFLQKSIPCSHDNLCCQQQHSAYFSSSSKTAMPF